MNDLDLLKQYNEQLKEKEDGRFSSETAANEYDSIAAQANEVVTKNNNDRDFMLEAISRILSLTNSCVFESHVLEQKKQEQTTASGIVLPGSDKEMPMQGKVVAVGPGGIIDGNEVKMEVKVGQDVIYSKYSGSEVKIENETYLIMSQEDVLGILE